MLIIISYTVFPLNSGITKRDTMTFANKYKSIDP